MTDAEVIYSTKPSLRRAYFYVLVCAGLISYGRVLTGLDPTFNSVWLSLLGLLAVLLALAHLRRWCISYTITDQEVRVTAGIIARRLAVVPHQRITNAAARQTVLGRLLGLVDLQIDAAGRDFSEIVFQRITKRDAQQAGKIIREILKKSRPPG